MEQLSLPIHVWFVWIIAKRSKAFMFTTANHFYSDVNRWSEHSIQQSLHPARDETKFIFEFDNVWTFSADSKFVEFFHVPFVEFEPQLLFLWYTVQYTCIRMTTFTYEQVCFMKFAYDKWEFFLALSHPYIQLIAKMSRVWSKVIIIIWQFLLHRNMIEPLQGHKCPGLQLRCP